MSREAIVRFDCFGSSCAVHVTGSGRLGSAELAAQLVRRQLLEWHMRFSRFDPSSELSVVNRDPHPRVEVTRTMALLADAVVSAANATGGLVDGTLLGEIQSAGYTDDLDGSLPLRDALALAPPREPGSPSPLTRWREIAIDVTEGVMVRSPGVMIDSGGLAKGLFADLAAEWLGEPAAYAVDCGGDLRLGGSDRAPRTVAVTDPFAERVLHSFELAEGGVATSGIGTRSWLDESGKPAHHLLDPGSGRPAFTGIVQVTALAPSALEAETLAKAALLSGPQSAHEWLPHGGVVVYEDGAHEVLEPTRKAHRNGHQRHVSPLLDHQ
jgi:thiamine biosynthesis lipoprotein